MKLRHACIAALLALASTQAAAAITPLVSFDGTNGKNPVASLVQGRDGNLYGTTESGGASDRGTIFKVTTSGALTTLFSFDGATGAYPQGKLVRGTDGNFYGTTTAGGSSDLGTVYRVASDGTFATLISFDGSNGANPRGGLIQARDGNFYGTTVNGGPGSRGTIFRLTASGALTTLVWFDGTNGGHPYTALVEATDGSLYGTTFWYGDYNWGTLFKVTTSGDFTTLFSFSGSFGDHPGANVASALIQGRDGNLYGTSANGGAPGGGTIFRVTPAGDHVVMGAFNSNPWAGLVQGYDDYLYGTTFYGGATGNGSFFKMAPDGTFVGLDSFSGGDGAHAYASLIQATDGNFYGTSYLGGDNGAGVIYRLDGPPFPPTTVSLTLTPSTIGFGQSAILSWTASAESSCVASGAWDGARENSGSESVTPASAGEFTYELTCTGPGSSASSSATLVVNRASTSLHAAPDVLRLNALQIRLSMKAVLSASDPERRVSGKLIKFYTSTGQFLCSDITNDRGAASCGTILTNVPVILGLGYKAVFEGDASYESSSDRGPLIK